MKMRSCSECGRITDTKLCEGCQSKRPKRPSATKRGYGKEFRTNRLKRLALDPLCTCPGCTSCSMRHGPCAREANLADHLKPKSKGGSDALSNLRSMCSFCHSKHTSTESPGGWNAR